MNEIVKVFNDRPVRILDRDGELWFVAKDVCKVLEIKLQANSTRYLDDDERGVCLINTPSGEQEMTIINEPGLYSLILRSRKAEAKAFKRWVTHDVLPSIRKTGAYLAPAASDRQIKALITTIEQEIYRRIAAEQEIKCLQRQLEKLTLAAMPKSQFGELSRKTGLPKDKIISTHLRSDKRPHRPQVEKFVQLLLPLYISKELFAQTLLPILGNNGIRLQEKANA